MNIQIKPFQKENINKTFEWINHKELRHSFLLRKKIDWKSHLNWYKSYIMDENQKIFGIYHDECYCGNCGLKNINLTDRKAELWIYLGDINYQGKGIGFFAIEQLIHYSFTELNLRKLYLHVAEFNNPASKLYEKVGFKIEGIFIDEIYLNNTYENIIRMYLIKKEN